MSMLTTGCDMAHYAILQTDIATPPGATPVAPVYTEPKPLLDLTEIGVSSSDTFDVVHADNAPKIPLASKSEKTLNIVRFDYSPEEKAALLGWERTAEGDYFETASSLPPDIALGFRIEKSDQSYLYVWLFKGKIAINQTNATTRQQTPTPQFAPAIGTFVARNSDNAFQAIEQSDAAFAEEWFTLDNLQRRRVPAIQSTTSSGAVGISEILQSLIKLSETQPENEELKAVLMLASDMAGINTDEEPPVEPTEEATTEETHPDDEY